jgi:hypothetical protein
MSDPVLYDNPRYEHADVAVLFCRDALIDQGCTVEASKLEGIDVTCPAMARVALNVLRGIRVRGPAAEYVEIAKHLVREALAIRVLRIAS